MKSYLAIILCVSLSGCSIEPPAMKRSFLSHESGSRDVCKQWHPDPTLSLSDMNHFVSQNCASCHGPSTASGGFNVVPFNADDKVSLGLMLDALRSERMPPAGSAMQACEAEEAVKWLEAKLGPLAQKNANEFDPASCDLSVTTQQSIVQKNCAVCHSGAQPKGGITLNPHETPSTSLKQLVTDSVKSKRMPPALPLSGCEELAVLRWAAGDSPTDLNNPTQCQINTTLTFANDISPLINRACAGCHNSSTKQAGLNLTLEVDPNDSHRTTAERWQRSYERVRDKTMPPAGSLTACEQNLLAAWATQVTLNNPSEQPLYECGATQALNASYIPVRPFTKNEIEATFYGLQTDYGGLTSAFSETVNSLFSDDASAQYASHQNTLSKSATFGLWMISESAANGLALNPHQLRFVDGSGCLHPYYQTFDETCLRSFINWMAPAVTRRPITAEWTNQLVNKIVELYGAPTFALRQSMLEFAFLTMFLNPRFTHHIYLGEPTAVAGDSDVFALTQYELAERTFYALTGKSADKTALTDVEAGQFLTKFEDHLTRIFSTPVATPGPYYSLLDSRAWGYYYGPQKILRDFWESWLGVQKNAPMASDAELAAFMMKHFLEGKTYGDLHRSAVAYGNWNTPYLGVVRISGIDYPFYDVTETVTRDTLYYRQDPARRSGLLTRLAILQSKGQRPSPPHRAKLVIKDMLCETMAAPDPAAFPPGTFDAPPSEPGSTNREVWALKTSPQACQGCHGKLDPIGFMFENYDSTGFYRTTDEGKPIDATGSITVDSTTHNLNNINELAPILATSRQAHECFVRNATRALMARSETIRDRCVLKQTTDKMLSNEKNLTQGFLEIIRSPEFRHLRRP